MRKLCACMCVCAVHSVQTGRTTRYMCVHSCVPMGRPCSVHTCVWAGCVCVCVCICVCSYGLQGHTGPMPCPFPGVFQSPVEEHEQSCAGPHRKALTQQLVSIQLHLQRRPRNENPMGTLVGVNKYAIKMRKSKLWTGLFSCPLISFITEILLLNNISVNNLSSVFRSARVNNSITGGGSPLAWPWGQQPCPGKGLLRRYLPHHAQLRWDVPGRETRQHRVAQASATGTVLGWDPRALAALLQREGLCPF